MLLLALLVLGALAGLISSETGTRFLAERAKHWLGDAVSWETLDGRIVGPLAMSGLQVSLPGINLDLAQLELDWEPGALLQGELRITRLEAESGSLSLNPGDEPASSQPFDPSALRAPLDIRLSEVRLRDWSISQPDAPTQQIDSLDLEATLEGEALSLQRFELRLPEGGLAMSGETAMRAKMPLRLEAAWEWRLPKPAEADTAMAAGSSDPLRGELSLDGALDWGAAIGVDLRYQVRIEGVDALAPELPSKLSLDGRLAGEQQGAGASIEAFTFDLVDTPLTLEFAGKLERLDTASPVADLELAWQDLQWPLTGDEPIVRSTRGELAIVGSVDGYNLDLAADVAASGLPPGQWELRGRGDQTTLMLEALRGQVLGGELRTRGTVGWDPVPSWELHVVGEALDPGAVLEEVHGELALAMDTTGTFDTDTGLSAEVALHELRGLLMDRPLQASAVARLAGETVAMDSVTLASEGNTLSTSGELAPDQLTLDWNLDAANPGALLPGAQGHLNAKGKVTGTPDTPRLAATFESTALALEDLTVARAEGSVEAGLDPEEPLALALILGPVRSGEQTILQDARLEVQGKLAAHELSLEADTAGERLTLGLDGGLDAELTTWSGRLNRLSLETDGYGRWHLLAPADLTLSEETVALDESCLERENEGGEVCLGARRAEAGQSSLSASLQDLPVASFLPAMTGALAGEAQATLAADGRMDMEANFRLTPGEVRVPMGDSEESLPHGGGELRLTVDPEGLLADLRFAAPEEGQVVAEVRLPRFTTLPPTNVQPLAGRAQANLPRLDMLAAWVPELASTAGRLDANLDLAGTLEQPEVTGELNLAGGQADIPMAGLALREIELEIASDPGRPGNLDIRGDLRSGEGRLRIKGEADPAAGTFSLEVAGQRLAAYDTPDARVLLSPDLQVGWRDETLHLRGSLTIPKAAITPQLSLRSAAAPDAAGAADTPGQVLAPSPDVVIVNAGEDEQPEPAPAAAPFVIDSQVRVALGDQVSVDALGFRSRLTGAVTFTHSPDRDSLIPIAKGQFEVRDGTFRAFGQDLEIETGQLIFPTVPATEPELNVRAVRWIQDDPEVTAAGVLVTGPATQPVLTLFSRPQLEDPSEIQSYLLTGSSPGDRSNVLSVGTYLSPRFYVGYGYNVLESTSEFNSLFNITPRYGISANVGEADSNINLTVTYEN
ncbi:MAG: translocation/assembly module TamB domain-containing protein [Xanthomonadales bacterium]|nr:translocation/assembly module TamB domain-containing protein [Xanthomonadales bacterium]